MPRTPAAHDESADRTAAPSTRVKRARAKAPSTAQLLAAVRDGQEALLRELHALETRMQVIETRLTTIASNDNHDAHSAPPMTIHPLPSFGPMPSPTRNTLPFIESPPTVAPEAMPRPPVGASLRPTATISDGSARAMMARAALSSALKAAEAHAANADASARPASSDVSTHTASFDAPAHTASFDAPAQVASADAPPQAASFDAAPQVEAGFDAPTSAAIPPGAMHDDAHDDARDDTRVAPDDTHGARDDAHHALTTPPPDGFVPVPPEAFLAASDLGYLPSADPAPTALATPDAAANAAPTTIAGAGPSPAEPAVHDTPTEEEWFANPPMPAGPSRGVRFALHAVVTLACALIGAHLGGWRPGQHAPAPATHADAGVAAEHRARPEHAAHVDAGSHRAAMEDEGTDSDGGVAAGFGGEAPRTVRTVDPRRPAMSAREIVLEAFPTPAERAEREARAAAARGSRAHPTAAAHEAPAAGHAAPAAGHEAPAAGHEAPEAHPAPAAPHAAPAGHAAPAHAGH